MSDKLVISIDAMGGDNSPRVVIEGLAIAAKKNPDANFLLFGDERKVCRKYRCINGYIQADT